MYHLSEIEHVLSIYDTTHSFKETIRLTGYPSRETLRLWLRQRQQGSLPPASRGSKRATRPRHSNVTPEERIRACVRSFGDRNAIRAVAKELGVDRSSLYTWIRKYQEGSLPMKKKKSKRAPQSEVVSNKDQEIRDLQEALYESQMEADILRETIKILKKDPGVDPSQLKNSERAAIIDALKGIYPLPHLLLKLKLPRSSYYYQQAVAKRADKYYELRKKIREAFEKENKCYGYRRVQEVLAAEGIYVSEKVIRRIMAQEGLIAKRSKRRGYSSYMGEISPAVPNLLERDFHADAPNQKWVTDISEFKIPAGKVYLSVIVDCYDGLVTAWKIGRRPNAALVNDMLDEAIATLQDEKPIVHSDRGVHYRWKGWIERMDRSGLTRSMSKKGCSPDNAACEGFFGRMKVECFYDENFSSHTLAKFMKYLDKYLHWYNEKRIKMSLGGKSPLQYRQLKGIAV